MRLVAIGGVFSAISLAPSLALACQIGIPPFHQRQKHVTRAFIATIVAVGPDFSNIAKKIPRPISGAYPWSYQPRTLPQSGVLRVDAVYKGPVARYLRFASSSGTSCDLGRVAVGNRIEIEDTKPATSPVGLWALTSMSEPELWRLYRLDQRRHQWRAYR